MASRAEPVGPAGPPRHRFRAGAGPLIPVLVVALLAAVPAACSDGEAPRRARTAAAVDRPVGLDADRLGIATGALLWGATSAQVDREAARIADLGARWLRAVVRWDGVEPTRAGVARWERVDALVGAVRRHGLRLLVTLSGTPRWARASARAPASVFAADPADYGAFAGRIARRYRGRVDAWELGNEPNHIKSFAEPDARRYLGFLRAGYEAIKAADPSAVVLSGGIGGTRDARGDIPGDEFVAQLYALGAQRWFDAVSYHPYTYPLLPSQDDEGERGWSRMDGVRRTMVANGDGATRVWVTEFGAPTGGPSERRAVSPAEQALMLRDGYRLAARTEWIGPMFWFTYRDRGTDPALQADHFGLVSASGVPKPAAQEYRAIAAAARSD